MRILNFTPVCINNKSKKVNNLQSNYALNDNKVQTYNPLYYNDIAFCAKANLREQMSRLTKDNYPSNEVYELAQKTLEDDYYTDKTIYDIHNEFYRDLFNCKTLEEAKELYPEFVDVVDAKDLDANDKNLPQSLRQVLNDENEYITAEDLSLELLKKTYKGLKGIGYKSCKEQYFGLSRSTIEALIGVLNIKKFSNKYSSIYRHNSPDVREKEELSRKNFTAITKIEKDIQKCQKNTGQILKIGRSDQKRAKNICHILKIEKEA